MHRILPGSPLVMLEGHVHASFAAKCLARFNCPVRPILSGVEIPENAIALFDSDGNRDGKVLRWPSRFLRIRLRTDNPLQFEECGIVIPERLANAAGFIAIRTHGVSLLEHGRLREGFNEAMQQLAMRCVEHQPVSGRKPRPKPVLRYRRSFERHPNAVRKS